MTLLLIAMTRSHTVASLNQAILPIYWISTTVVASDWCITNLTLTAYSGLRSEVLVCIVKMTLREVVSENRAKY